MAFVDVAPFDYPPALKDPSSGFTNVTMTINATNDRVAFVFDVPKSGTLDLCEFMTSTVTQSPANGLDVSFQGVGSDGLPDGTRDQFRVIAHPIAANTWQVPGLMTSDGTDTGTKRTVTKGERLAVVIGFSSFVASDSLQIRLLQTTSEADNRTFVANGTTGTFARSQDGPLLALKYSDGTYVPISSPGIAGPYTALTSTTFNLDSTPDERGLRFRLSAPMRISGLWATMASGGNDYEVVLYDEANAVLASKAVEGNDGGSISAAEVNPQRFIFDESIELQANVTYRMTIRPTTTSNVTVFVVTVPSGRLGAIATGVEWYGTSRSGNSGDFTDSETTYYFLGLVVDGIDAGGAAGGGNSGGACYINYEG